MKKILKRILVLSDNPELMLFFKDECVRQEIDKIATINYCYSLNNKDPIGMITAGAEPVDVKDLHFVETAKNSYNLILSLHMLLQIWRCTHNTAFTMATEQTTKSTVWTWI
jgi:hypothetical protein